jgi:acetyl esterase
MQPEPQTGNLLENMAATGAPPLHELPLPGARAALAELSRTMGGSAEEVGATEDRSVPGPAGPVPVRIYRPATASGRRPPVLLLFHGGGFALGDIETHDTMARYYCNHAGVVVVNVDYRRSPEYPFPAGVEDCYAVLQWAADRGADIGADPARIAVTGDSAGGNISAALCLATRERRGPPIAFQALAYPAVDLTPGAASAYPSRAAFGGGEYFLSAKDIAWVTDMYFTDAARDSQNPLASPMLAPDLSGLPQALIITAGLDPLLDEALAYHRRLVQNGIASEYRCFEGTIHGFLSFAGVLDAAREGLSLIANRVRQALNP